MAWIAVNSYKCEFMFRDKPFRNKGYWDIIPRYNIPLPLSSIKKLIGRRLSWNDEPVELKEGLL